MAKMGDCKTRNETETKRNETRHNRSEAKPKKSSINKTRGSQEPVIAHLDQSCFQ